MVPDTQRAASGTESSPERERMLTWLGLALLLLVQSIALVRQRPPYLEDDGAFFLRYAENLAAGNGYRWNAGEAPVWGASAPLWPLLLAAGLAAGLTPLAATLVWSVGLTLAATLVLGLAARRVFGVLGLFALAPLLALNFLYSTWATSGLESPLTFLLVALALLVVAANAGAVACGVVAGLCLVHKLDVAPLGVALLVALALWRRDQFWRSLAIAAVIAAVGYGLATWYFGTPVPNSFLRKLARGYGKIPRTWFADMALFAGAGWLRTALAIAGAFALRRRPEVATVALAAVLVPTLAYTLKPPAEGFLWYPAAVSGAVAFLAAGGFAFLIERVPSRRMHTRAVVAAAALLLVAVILESGESPLVRRWHRFLTATMPPMRAGGEWVDAHLSADARVLTGFGHPALASRRFVYDQSFLNRRPEEGSLRVKYQPEAVIELVKEPLERYRVPPGYRLAQVFEPLSEPGVKFTGVAVLVRAGVPVDGLVVEPLPPRGWELELVRQLLGEVPIDADGLDPVRLESLSRLIAERRALPDPPPWLDRVEQRIREIQAAR